LRGDSPRRFIHGPFAQKARQQTGLKPKWRIASILMDFYEVNQMTTLELMTVLRSLKKLHEVGKPEAALEVIEEIITMAESEKE